MKILKIAGFILASVVMMVVLFYFYASWRIDQRITRQYDIVTEQVSILSDSVSVANGKHLVDIKGCRDCHGDNLGGKVFADDALIGTLAGPNLTRGRGGVPQNYSVANWVKAIRHGVDSNNHPLIVMPSLETSKMSKEDLASMIGYLNTLEPVNNDVPESKLGIMITVMAHLDQIPVIPAEEIDHQTQLTPTANLSSPVEYGKYLSTMCSGCHHENMKGGDPMAPGMPPVPDLTSTGAAGRWTQEQFNDALRTGTRPDGTTLDESMPVQMTKHYTDKELDALYTYFKTL